MATLKQLRDFQINLLSCYRKEALGSPFWVMNELTFADLVTELDSFESLQNNSVDLSDFYNTTIYGWPVHIDESMQNGKVDAQVGLVQDHGDCSGEGEFVEYPKNV